MPVSSVKGVRSSAAVALTFWAKLLKTDRGAMRPSDASAERRILMDPLWSYTDQRLDRRCKPALVSMGSISNSALLNQITSVKRVYFFTPPLDSLDHGIGCGAFPQVPITASVHPSITSRKYSMKSTEKPTQCFVIRLSSLAHCLLRCAPGPGRPEKDGGIVS